MSNFADFSSFNRLAPAESGYRLEIEGVIPYRGKVSNNKTQSPYDYYWGGYNTITKRRGGITGKNGWYYNRLIFSHSAQYL